MAFAHPAATTHVKRTQHAHLHLDVARVNDVQDAVDREGRLSNVGGHDALAGALWRRVEYLGLFFGATPVGLDAWT